MNTLWIDIINVSINILHIINTKYSNTVLILPRSKCEITPLVYLLPSESVVYGASVCAAVRVD